MNRSKSTTHLTFLGKYVVQLLQYSLKFLAFKPTGHYLITSIKDAVSSRFNHESFLHPYCLYLQAVLGDFFPFLNINNIYYNRCFYFTISCFKLSFCILLYKKKISIFNYYKMEAKLSLRAHSCNNVSRFPASYLWTVL